MSHQRNLKALLFTSFIVPIIVLIMAASNANESLPSDVPIPSDNPMTPSKIELGKILYFDSRLSKNNKVSCNTCHNVMTSGTDNKPVSTGVDNKKGGRNSPTVWNSAFWAVQFWDGRAKSLEAQAIGPMTNPVEMGMENHDEVIKKIKGIGGYGPYFEKAFGANSINIDNVAKAIAAYERTLVTPNSAFDRYLKGEEKALTSHARKGYEIVKTIGCMNCHSGPHFNGPVQSMGQGFYMKFPLISGSHFDKKYNLSADLGRFESSKLEQDKNFWRVPSWRNIALTAPYFHNGSVKTLPEAVRVMAKTQLGKDLKENEVGSIVAFLNSLTGERPKQVNPSMPQ